MFLTILLIAFSLLYFFLLFLFPFFFGSERRKMSREVLLPLIYIALVCLVFFSFIFSINDPTVANRLQHGLGGGALSFLVCFFAAKWSRVMITKFQFFFFSFLIVTALGVANEVLEYFLQNYFSLLMSSTINDTWLDLISNTVGAFIAGAFLTPVFKSGKKQNLSSIN